MPFNIVELVADGDCAFDQRCKFGRRVEDHAVYCHNDGWADAPRKCRRSWYTNGRIKDEDCPGFEVNPEFKGELVPTPRKGDPCARCSGAKLVKGDRKAETCPGCAGSGEETVVVPLTEFEVEVLESSTGLGCSDGHPFVCICETEEEGRLISRLVDLDLVVMRSVEFRNDLQICLLESTMKGEAVVQKVWESRSKCL